MSFKTNAVASGILQTFAAFRYPNYRLWFYGQLTSLMGTWMQSTAQGYLVYEMTNSTAYLGYVSLAGGLAQWIFTLIAGVLVDRVSKRKLMVIAQAAMMLLAFVLTLLLVLGVLQPWHILILAFFLGVANAFDAPARQAFVVELVDRKELTNAIALNSAMFNAALVVGPAVGAMVYAGVGPAWCFFLNGVSFIAVIIALLLMRLEPLAHKPSGVAPLAQLREGLSYIRANPVVRTLITNVFMISIFGFGMITLLPAWARDILHGDEIVYGNLLSGRGVGALIGALIVASTSRYKIRGRLYTVGGFVFPLVMVVFTFIHSVPGAVLGMVGLGIGFLLLVNVANAMIQTSIPDNLRGRVMSVYILFFFGGSPIGSAVTGNLAEFWDPTTAVLINAIILLVFFTFVWLRHPEIRKLE
jgi:MFS family permease